MTETLDTLFETRMADPAISLMTRTATALRADADYFRSDDDVAGGLFLSKEEPAGLSDGALEQALARIEADALLDRRAAEQVAPGDGRSAELLALPSPLREAALEALRHRRWRFGGFGIRRLALTGSDRAQAELIRVEPGFGAADHDHGGDEYTLVITGAYRDSTGVYAPGDLALAKPGFSHTPRAEPGAVCYLLLVAEGPARFSGRVGLLQRTIGFPWAPRITTPD